MTTNSSEPTVSEKQRVKWKTAIRKQNNGVWKIKRKKSSNFTGHREDLSVTTYYNFKSGKYKPQT